MAEAVVERHTAEGNFDWRETLTREDIARLMEPNDLRAWVTVGVNWGIVFASMAWVAVWPNPLSVVVALVLIGTRQLGCAVVMLSLGYPMVTFLERIQTASGLGDLMGGLAKTLAFGLLIAGIGCLRGLQTRTGASAVGDSATRAVVSGIVAIVIADGVFAVLYYFLGI